MITKTELEASSNFENHNSKIGNLPLDVFDLRAAIFDSRFTRGSVSDGPFFLL